MMPPGKIQNPSYWIFVMMTTTMTLGKGDEYYSSSRQASVYSFIATAWTLETSLRSLEGHKLNQREHLECVFHLIVDEDDTEDTDNVSVWYLTM